MNPKNESICRCRLPGRNCPVRRGVVVCDLDGTLAQRLRPISAAMVRAILTLVDAGWRVGVLSGQPYCNLERRVLQVLRPDLLGNSARVASIRLYSCEGANEWRVTSMGEGLRNQCWSRQTRLSERMRNAVDLGLAECLPVLLRDAQARLGRAPRWDEDALCMFKVRTSTAMRLRIARGLRLTLQMKGIPCLRVGTAGASTIVISKNTATKRHALERIVASLAKGEVAYYLADEFGGAGNDAVTLAVRSLRRVDFGRSDNEAAGVRKSGFGAGPAAVVRWISWLLGNA